MKFKQVLFLCVANSARSQMAEGWGKKILSPLGVTVQSAGSMPSKVNPLAMEVMAEVDISLAAQTSKSVNDIKPETVDLVITLCAEEVCPVFLGKAERLHWPLTDPDRKHEPLSHEQRLEYFREARDLIRDKITALAAEL